MHFGLICSYKTGVECSDFNVMFPMISGPLDTHLSVGGCLGKIRKYDLDGGSMSVTGGGHKVSEDS